MSNAEQTSTEIATSEPDPDLTSSLADDKDTDTKSGGKGLAITALLLGLGALGLSGYQFWLQHQDTSDASLQAFDKQIAKINQQTQAVGKQQQVMGQVQQQQSAQLQLQLNNAIRPLQQSQQLLSQSVKKVYSELDRSLDSWALEEVEQLLRVSNHSLQLTANINTALTGLKLADQRLERIANPELLPVRKQLAAEIAALSTVTIADIPGLALQLNNLNTIIDQLPLVNEPGSKLNTSQPDDEQSLADNTQQSRWQSAGSEVWGDLRKLVRIQNINAPAKALLAPEQRYFLYENLKLMINGSQTALLQKNKTVFVANVDRAQQWLNKYFEPDNSSVQSVLSTLSELKNIELNPELPSINQSLATLQSIKNKADK